MLGCFAAGVLVFFAAGALSESLSLRITSGALLFALGSTLIVFYVLFRLVPNRRGLAATAALLGSSSWAVLRWVTGQWMPSAYTLLHNRWFLGYVAASGLLGAAVTYLYGSVDNPKVRREAAWLGERGGWVGE